MARLTHDEWTVGKWKGTVETLLKVADGLVAAVPGGEGPPRVSVRVRWEGGSEDFESVAAVRQAKEPVPWDSVRSIEVSAYENSADHNKPKHHMALYGGPLGMHVRAEGPNPAIVHGLVRIGEEGLRTGEHGFYRRIPRTTREKVRLGIAGLLIVGAVGGSIAAIAFAEVGAFFLSYLVGLIGFAVWPTGAGKDTAPGLMLVSPEQEQADQARREPLTLRVRDWISEHPVIALLGSFTLGVLANVVADLITG